jgi:hypothetical protein
VVTEDASEILKFYEEFRSHSGCDHLEAMRVFLPRLFAERDLSGCTFHTSHETLCITRYSKYPEWLNKPSLFINCTTARRLRMEFQITLSTDPVARYITETVNCPLELGLQEFDLLYKKFLAAHENAIET